MIDPSEVAEVVGAENVTTGPKAERYAVSGVVPPLVAAPGTRDEAASLILRARERGWSLVPCGGGTGIDMGFPPRKLDLVLSTRRLDRVVDYQPDDMTVTVEPGVTLAALEASLADRQQFLPLDPPFPYRCTVGGTVAAAASGPWRAGFGTPRDWVIGCRVVGADGREVRGGGQVVKNVAGYDLPKLYTGSHGTLGLLTEVTFKVMPRPPAAAICRVSGLRPANAEALLTRVLHSDLQPTVAELAHTSVPQYSRAAPEAASPWLLFFQFMQVEEAVDWQLRQLSSMAAEVGAEAACLPDVEGRATLKMLRDAVVHAAFAARIGTVTGRVAEAAGRLAELCARRGVGPYVTAHAATGQVILRGGVETAALAEDVRALARELGATCVFPRLPAEYVGKIDPWGEPGPELRLMQGIKSTLDPTGVFSPGRFVGRL